MPRKLHQNNATFLIQIKLNWAYNLYTATYYEACEKKVKLENIQTISSKTFENEIIEERIPNQHFVQASTCLCKYSLNIVSAAKIQNLAYIFIQER